MLLKITLNGKKEVVKIECERDLIDIRTTIQLIDEDLKNKELTIIDEGINNFIYKTQYNYYKIYSLINGDLLKEFDRVLKVSDCAITYYEENE